MSDQEKAIRDFVVDMISELSGTDNGVDFVMDDYTEENIKSYMEYYLKQILKSPRN